MGDSFKQRTKEDFPLLGLVTNRLSRMYSLKGKPISFRSKAKVPVDITIRNTGEFAKFLDQGQFQRQHISSLLAQCFDPSFTFNSIYHNVARLINRRILQSTPGTMPMYQKSQPKFTTKIHNKCHNKSHNQKSQQTSQPKVTTKIHNRKSQPKVEIKSHNQKSQPISNPNST